MSDFENKLREDLHLLEPAAVTTDEQWQRHLSRLSPRPHRLSRPAVLAALVAAVVVLIVVAVTIVRTGALSDRSADPMPRPAVPVSASRTTVSTGTTQTTASTGFSTGSAASGFVPGRGCWSLAPSRNAVVTSTLSAGSTIGLQELADPNDSAGSSICAFANGRSGGIYPPYGPAGTLLRFGPTATWFLGLVPTGTTTIELTQPDGRSTSVTSTDPGVVTVADLELVAVPLPTTTAWVRAAFRNAAGKVLRLDKPAATDATTQLADQQAEASISSEMASRSSSSSSDSPDDFDVTSCAQPSQTSSPPASINTVTGSYTLGPAVGNDDATASAAPDSAPVRSSSADGRVNLNDPSSEFWLALTCGSAPGSASLLFSHGGTPADPANGESGSTPDPTKAIPYLSQMGPGGGGGNDALNDVLISAFAPTTDTAVITRTDGSTVTYGTGGRPWTALRQSWKGLIYFGPTDNRAERVTTFDSAGRQMATQELFY